MNRIVLVGRLIRDPEFKVFEDGSKVFTRLILAVDRPYKTAAGEKHVDFIPVVLRGKKAEIVNEYLVKGSIISVTGRLQSRQYEGEDGHKKYISEVIADEFQFMSNNNKKKKDDDVANC